MPPIRRPGNAPTPRPPTSRAPKAETWTVGGEKWKVWPDPARGSSEIIRNSVPAIYFTDGLEPRERMRMTTPDGAEIVMVGVATKSGGRTPVLPPPPPPSTGYSRPPAPPTTTGGKGTGGTDGNFFNVKGGFSSNMYPESYLRDYLGDGPDSYRAAVGEGMTIAEWKANGYPGGSSKSPQDIENAARENRMKADIEGQRQRDREETETREELLSSMTPEDRQRYIDGEMETHAIEERDRERKGYPFFRR